jgi:hypothetical protein
MRINFYYINNIDMNSTILYNNDIEAKIFLEEINNSIMHSIVGYNNCYFNNIKTDYNLTSLKWDKELQQVTLIGDQKNVIDVINLIRDKARSLILVMPLAINRAI